MEHQQKPKPEIPFLNFPDGCRKELFKHMDLIKKISFAQCSKKCTEIIKSTNFNVVAIQPEVDRDLVIHISGDENVDVYFPKPNEAVPVALETFTPRSVTLVKLHEEEYEVNWDKNNKGLVEWIKTLLDLFHLPKLESFKLGNHRPFNRQSIVRVMEQFKIKRLTLDQASKKTAQLALKQKNSVLNEVPVLEIDRNPDQHSTHDAATEFLIRNYEILQLGSNFVVKPDVLMAINSSFVYIQGPGFTAKSLNRFIKLWKEKRVNTRLQYLQISRVPQLTEAELFKGIPTMEVRRARTKLIPFEMLDEGEMTVNTGFEIFGNGGRAVINLTALAVNGMTKFEMAIFEQ